MSDNPLRLPNDPQLRQAVRDVMDATDDEVVIEMRVRVARLLYDTMDEPDIDLMCATLMHRLVDDETILNNHEVGVIEACDTIIEEISGLPVKEVAEFPNRYKAFYAAMSAVSLEMIMELNTGRTETLWKFFTDTDDMMEAFGSTGYKELDEYVELMLGLAEDELEVLTRPSKTSGGHALAAVRLPPKGTNVTKWVAKNGRKLF